MSSNTITLSRLLVTERPRLLRLIRSILGTAADVDDVAQSLYERILHVREHPPILNPRSYLFRLAVNQALRQNSQGKRRVEVLDSGRFLLDKGADILSPERISIGREEIRRTEQAIATLPEAIRRVVVLSRFEGMSYPDIAKELGVSQATVERYIRRALDAIAAARDDRK